MTDTENVKHDRAADTGASPSIDESTRQPIEEAEDNLSRFSTKDSSPTISEQGRTTEKGDDGDQPLSGSELRKQGVGRP
ncbi:MAG TPA: hypothetical protein VGX92_13480 [Pyrinomonadaceae bacterium]|nr:hypothetical protein [Pyrinomonadaceae bacterium]